MRKLLLRTLSVCLVCCSSSVFALQSEGKLKSEFSPLARELNEQAMASLLGRGNVDIEMADYQQSDMSVEAVITNRSILILKYEMNLVTPDGVIIGALASGSVPQNQTITVAGTPPTTGGVQDQLIRVRTFSGIKSLAAVNSIASPTSIDTDGDGLFDAFEVSVGLDANNSEDAHQDLDEDGLSNIVEILDYFTDFNNPDTDGDSISDGDEVTYGLDPNDDGDANLDLDRDFVSNADEINIHNTNPNEYSEGISPDTDGDGVNDIVELALGLDVNDDEVRDVGGNSDSDKRHMHILNRLTFGPIKESLDAISAMGIEDWIANEMTILDYITLSTNPDSDPAQRLRVDNMVRFDANPDRVGAIRPVHSSKQLQSKMALFWDNHFNTYINKTRNTLAELQEEDDFFVNALGNFRDLLHVSAKSNPMLNYLDLIVSTKEGPNENYAREVMELHALGATLSDVDDSGQSFYDADDIDSLSKILTGWRSDNSGPISLYRRAGSSTIIRGNQRAFVFSDDDHDGEAKEFLGTVYPVGGGLEEGEQALDVLAYHERTAWFICNKLAKFIVSDNPSAATVDVCKTNFIANKTAPDQIAQALQALLTSEEFTNEENQRAKFKDNQEYMFALARFMDVQAIGTLVPIADEPNFEGMLFLGKTAFGDAVRRTGQGLFLKAPPTGYKEEPDEWITGNAAISRFREGNEIIFKNNTVRNLTGYFSSQNLTTSKQVLGHVFKLMLGGYYGNREMEMGYWVLHPNNEAFDLNAAGAETKLKNLIARVAQLPEHNLH